MQIASMRSRLTGSRHDVVKLCSDAPAAAFDIWELAEPQMQGSAGSYACSGPGQARFVIPSQGGHRDRPLCCRTCCICIDQQPANALPHTQAEPLQVIVWQMWWAQGLHIAAYADCPPGPLQSCSYVQLCGN